MKKVKYCSNNKNSDTNKILYPYLIYERYILKHNINLFAYLNFLCPIIQVDVLSNFVIDRCSFYLVLDDTFFDAQDFPDQPSSTSDQAKEYSDLHLKLLYFFLLYKISNNAMCFLLQVLRDEGLEVPTSMYFFKKPSLSNKVEIVRSNLQCGGTFAYISIKENIEYCIKNKLLNFSNIFVDLKIKIGIDGIPIFKSSPVNLWPILLIFRDLSFKKALPVGIYCGLSKPHFNGFFEFLTKELLLFKDYVPILGFNIKIIDVLFICDSPARSFCQCSKSHSGYNACPYCRVHGLYEGKVIYPYSECEPRSDDHYVMGLENNQLSISPLASICSMTKAFPPEYMHSVCLGVVRRLLLSFFTGTFGRLNCRLSETLISNLDSRLKLYKNCLPSEFQRKIRSFRNVTYFKATEFRTVLLYTGPFFSKMFFLLLIMNIFYIYTIQFMFLLVIPILNYMIMLVMHLTIFYMI